MTKVRPSPTDSATIYAPGTVKRGNDGDDWEVRVNSAGVQRWVKITSIQPPAPQPVVAKAIARPHVLIKPTAIPQVVTPHKFKVGDRVKIVSWGAGCNDATIGEVVTITELGYYNGTPGYKIDNLTIKTNTKSGFYDGFIGEASFELVKSAPQQTLTTNPRIMSTQTKRPTVAPRKKAAETRNIETSLINKEEVFKMLALAESTGLPLLLVGQPGVAKTKTVIEYAKAWLNRDGQMSPADFANKIYILETDEGTKASEIKGMPDLGKLFTENKYELAAPIAEAEIVVINEVDKASSAIRNAMLGVMNERFLFNGKHKIPCKWKLFVATCNEIPKEEANSPFWDRFMLKHTVNRVSAGEMVKYYKKGARNYREKFAIGIPSKTEIEAVDVPHNKLEKYLEVGYTSSSDRTLTFVPSLTKAVSYIWDISMDKALVKTAQIMISQTAGSELQNKLMSPEVKAVMSKVEMLHSYTTSEQLELAVAEIESLINTYATRGVMDEGQVLEIETSMQYILNEHPARAEYKSAEEFDEMLDEVDTKESPGF